MGVCLWCGSSFNAKRSTKKFCDSSCRVAHHLHEKEVRRFDAYDYAHDKCEFVKRDLASIARHPEGKQEVLFALDHLKSMLDDWQNQIADNGVLIQKTLSDK